jgi:hypothetical protein
MLQKYPDQPAKPECNSPRKDSLGRVCECVKIAPEFFAYRSM